MSSALPSHNGSRAVALLVFGQAELNPRDDKAAVLLADEKPYSAGRALPCETGEVQTPRQTNSSRREDQQTRARNLPQQLNKIRSQPRNCCKPPNAVSPRAIKPSTPSITLAQGCDKHYSQAHSLVTATLPNGSASRLSSQRSTAETYNKLRQKTAVA